MAREHTHAAPAPDSASAVVHGIGVGPGDPGLLTLRAAEVLRGAALVVAPVSRAENASIALGIAREHVPADCEVVELEFPMTRDAAVREAAARRAADVLADASRSGHSAVFLTLGDSTLYSTWGYVRDALASRHADVPVETVPGVTAAAAAAASLGRSLAEGDEPLLFWPKEPPADFGELLDTAPAVVVLKGGRHLEDVIAAAEAACAGESPASSASCEITVSGVRRAGHPDEVVALDARDLTTSPPDYLTTVLVHRRRAVSDAE